MGANALSTSPTPNSDRPVKKRASQACSHCRTRKVKCDLVKSGIPCHNCSADGIECVTTESRRSRKFRLQKRQLTRLTSIPLLPQTQPGPANSTPQPNNNILLTPSIPPATISTTRSQSSHGEMRALPNNLRDLTSPSQDHGSPIAPIVSGNQFQSPSAFTPVLSLTQPYSHRGTTSTPSTVQASYPFANLPSYILPPQREFNPEDLEFLNRRGAFSMPDNELRDQLLKSFILYVYPYLPVVDLQELLDALEGNDGSQISLILFQAVMFAGTAFIDIQFLDQAGFADRRTARAYFYNKIKLLYDFDWEADRPTITQTIILHAYWYVAENDQKDPWHWLGIAISLATSAGMNQKVAYTKKDTKTCRLWRRIWWSCFIRDRVMAISMRKPMRFRDDELALPVLTIDDFEIQPLKTSIQALQDCPFMDVRTRRALAEMCIAKIKILSIIGRIIKKLYVLQGFAGSTADSIMLYTPKKSNFEAKEVFELQDELDRWDRTLPSTCKILLNEHPSHPTEQFLHLHRSVLGMVFWMASEALHRPQTLAKGPSNSMTNFLQQKSKPRVKEAAEKMSGLIQSLRELNHIRFLPPISVAFILPAIASFLMEIKATGKSLGDLPGHEFHQCVRALLSLRDIWPIADSACFLVGQMITNSQIGTARTLGMQSTPIASGDNSSRESSTARQPEDALDTMSIEEHVSQASAMDGVDQPEITGVVIPATDLGYSPANIGNDAGGWGDQFQFPWTIAEFGFTDDFILDEGDLYIDPAMADHSIDNAFNHDLMELNTAGVSVPTVLQDPPQYSSTSEDWRNESSEQYPQHFQASIPPS